MSTPKTTPASARARSRVPGEPARRHLRLHPDLAGVGVGPRPRTQRLPRLQDPRAAKAWRRTRWSPRPWAPSDPPAGSTPTLGDALAGLLDDMRAGIALTRSGTRYKPASIRTYDYQRPGVGRPGAPAAARSPPRRPATGHRPVARRTPLRQRHPQRHRRGAGGLPARHPRRSRQPRPDATPGPAGGAPQADPGGARRRPGSAAGRAAGRPARAVGRRPVWRAARGELRALRWSHVDLEAGAIHVAKGWDDVEGEA